MSTMRRIQLALLCALISGFNLALPGAALAAPTETEIEAAISERADFGLPADRETVVDLLTSGQDVGTVRLGIPMTAQEEAALDLPGRMAFANAIHEELMPYLETLLTFGGVYIDQERNGGLVVSLTAADPKVEANVAALAPSPNRGIAIRYVATPQAELRSAAVQAWEVWLQLAPAIELRAVGVDVAGNQLRIRVADVDLPDAAVPAGEVARQLGVAVEVQPAEAGAEDACTSRDNCTTPMKAGIRIRQGSQYSTTICSMAFHIRIGTNEQFLTAGHCGHSGSNNWYHIGYGANKVGSELGTLYQQNGQDAMRVEMPDAQADDQIFGISSNIVGHRDPVQGEAVLASLGNTNAVDGGTVSEDFHSWTGDSCGCTIWGANHDNISTAPGDSGSPISVGSIGGSAVAVGIHNRATGDFARMDDVVDALGAEPVL